MVDVVPGWLVVVVVEDVVVVGLVVDVVVEVDVVVGQVYTVPGVWVPLLPLDTPHSVAADDDARAIVPRPAMAPTAAMVQVCLSRISRKPFT